MTLDTVEVDCHASAEVGLIAYTEPVEYAGFDVTHQVFDMVVDSAAVLGIDITPTGNDKADARKLALLFNEITRRAEQNYIP